MSDRVNQRCLPPNSTGGLLGGVESQISGSPQSSWPRAHPSLSAGQPGMPATPTWCADIHQPDPLPRTPCPEALKLFIAAWRARTEPSETMPQRGTDSSRASVLPQASLCNHAASIPPHYRSNQRRGRRGGPRMGLPMISTPWCGDRGRTQAPCRR